MVSPFRVSLPMAHVRKLEVCENLIMNIAKLLLSLNLICYGIFASVLINDFLEQFYELTECHLLLLYCFMECMYIILGDYPDVCW